MSGLSQLLHAATCSVSKPSVKIEDHSDSSDFTDDTLEDVEDMDDNDNVFIESPGLEHRVQTVKQEHHATPTLTCTPVDVKTEYPQPIPPPPKTPQGQRFDESKKKLRKVKTKKTSVLGLRQGFKRLIKKRTPQKFTVYNSTLDLLDRVSAALIAKTYNNNHTALTGKLTKTQCLVRIQSSRPTNIASTIQQRIAQA